VDVPLSLAEAAFHPGAPKRELDDTFDPDSQFEISLVMLPPPASWMTAPTVTFGSHTTWWPRIRAYRGATPFDGSPTPTDRSVAA